MAVAALALAAVLFAPGVTQAEGWGTIKGQVVFGGSELPPNPPVDVNKDQAHCLSKGKILTDVLVVNPKNKGVRWVLVWLTDPSDSSKAAWDKPIHPSLKTPKPTVEIDQPCCVFEPRVLGIQEGQTLVVKNPAPIAHNFSITSIGGGPTMNPLTPPGAKSDIKGFVGKSTVPTPYSCSIHPWMKGYIGSFSHPYFAVTDKDGNFEIKNAPEGKHRIVVWHETGWVLQGKTRKDRGKVLDLKAGGTTDLGKITLTPSKD